MEVEGVVEAKKRRRESEMITNLQNQDALRQENGVAVEPQLEDSRREHSNAEVIDLSPSPLPNNKQAEIGDKDTVELEQNSSGLGDEIDIDEKNPSECLTGPEIFQTEDLNYEERLEAYAEILEGCAPFAVPETLRDYLMENVKATGWKAVWKVEQKHLECDVLVEVTEASIGIGGLNAVVNLIRPFQCILNGEFCMPASSEEKELQVTKELEKSDGVVRITDLFPVFDETGELDDTALAIEHVRFFYNHLWRPMDEDEDGEFSFLERSLKPRLKFMYDAKNKKIPGHIVNHYELTLAKFLTKSDTLQKLQAQLSDGNLSDMETDMNESRIAVNIMDLHQDIEMLKMTLEKLENPLFRSLMSLPSEVKGRTSSEARFARDDGSLVTFIVADRLTAGMIQGLDLSPEVIIEHQKSPGDALALCYHGDTILIFPGIYPGDGFYTLEQSVTIRGIGKREDVVIKCQELADIFVDCHAHRASVANLTLVDDNSETWDGIVAVRPGSTLEIDNCLFHSGATGVTIFKGGVLKMKGCEIRDIQGSGVRCNAGSTVHISESHIHDCGLVHRGDGDSAEDSQLTGGVTLKVEEGEPEDVTTLEIVGCKVESNGGTGIAVLVKSEQEGEPEPITSDVLKLIGGIHVTVISNNVFSDNLLGEAVLKNYVTGD